MKLAADIAAAHPGDTALAAQAVGLLLDHLLIAGPSFRPGLAPAALRAAPAAHPLLRRCALPPAGTPARDCESRPKLPLMGGQYGDCCGAGRAPAPAALALCSGHQLHGQLRVPLPSSVLRHSLLF